jgi:hypothetical protein
MSIMPTLLKGLVAILTTANLPNAGTDDHIYIGLVGRGGGREFALATSLEDFEVQPPGKPEVFLLGTFWDNPAASVPQAKYSLRSGPGGENDPARFEVDLDLVDYVYLRKQGDRSFEDDDAYALQQVVVYLYGPVTGQWRTFRADANNGLWLGNEFGHVVYLHDVTVGQPP